MLCLFTCKILLTASAVLEKFDRSWHLCVMSSYNSSCAKMSVQRSSFGFNFQPQRSLIIFNFLLQRTSCALYDPRASDHKCSEIFTTIKLFPHSEGKQSSHSHSQVAVLIIHTWNTRIADENENRAYHANRYDTCNTQNRFESKVLVLPVHSRETRHVSLQMRLVSFLSSRVSRETRRVSRDGGNLLLSGTDNQTSLSTYFREALLSSRWSISLL